MTCVIPMRVLCATLALWGCGSGSAETATAPSEPDVASVSLTPGHVTLSPGESSRLTAEVRQTNGAVLSGVSIAWSSSANQVATVSSDGTVTAVDAGSAVISATAAGRSASATVTVELVYDLDARGVPKLIGHDYIELAKIGRISRFRSGFGHDYSDDAESCRSMKHYFQPRADVDWGAVAISSPVAGTIRTVRNEQTFGLQVQLTANDYPAITVILFHVHPDAELIPGSIVQAGQRLGTHIGSQTMSDVAIRVDTPKGARFVSYFDAMTDALFQTYSARGVASRSAMIVTAAERDANPLSCMGEQFLEVGSLPNWVELL